MVWLTPPNQPSVLSMDTVLGTASLRRVGTLFFPTSVFYSEDGEVLAKLGRDGWFRVFFGRGRRVELPEGTTWRVTALDRGKYLEPRITSKKGKLAVGSSRGDRSYGINGRDYAYVLLPTGGGLFNTTWELREHDKVLATVGSLQMHAHYPVPLAAALLSFTLIKHGVPGEAKLGIPEFHWA